MLLCEENMDWIIGILPSKIVATLWFKHQNVEFAKMMINWHKWHLLEESTMAGSIRIELVGSTKDADI